MVIETAQYTLWWWAGLYGQLSAWVQESYKKVFLLQKEAGQMYDFCGVADQPTLDNLCS